MYYNLLGFIGVDPNAIEMILTGSGKWSIEWIIETSLVCDFGSLMSCSRHTRDLWASFGVFIMFYFIIYFAASSIGFPSLATLFLMSSPAFLLWYVYGMSFLCLPMVPPCALDDTVELLGRIFPTQFTLPSGLYCDGYNATYFPNTTVCLKSCQQLGFINFFDSLAYGVCWFDNVACGRWAPSVRNVSTALGDSFARFSSSVDSAHTLCMLIEFINSVPVIILLLVSLSAVSGLIYAVFNLIPSLIMLLAQMMAFTHTK